jgi:curved DNA-binding protein
MNYYKILNLKEDATEDEIKKSYRKLAMKYHPDRTNGDKLDEEKFKTINEAYATLSSPEKRRSYDFSLKNSSRTNVGNDDLDNMMNSFFRNSFDDMFRSSFFKQEQRRILAVTLSFWEAAYGTEKTYEFSLNSNQGKKTFKIDVKFEPATNTGDVIEIDLNGVIINLQINVDDDLKFERKNLDLYTKINVPVATAILGGTIKFPHWDKEFEVIIPPNIQQGQTVRLSNMGIKKNMFIGDLFLSINIELPKKLTKKQEELLTQFAEIENTKNNNNNDYFKTLWRTIFGNK